MPDLRPASLNFLDIDLDFLKHSQEWLGDAEFRALVLAVPPDRSAQLKWYESLPTRKDYRIWGVRIEGRWAGAFGLKNIDMKARKAEYWGYIYPSKYRDIGIGWRMFGHCVEYARVRELEQLYLSVARPNRAAYCAYLRWGFAEIESALPDIIRMEVTL